MKKNYQKIITLGIIFFAISEVSAQVTDSTKDKSIEEVVVLGSRAGSRIKTDTPVPVDVFDVQKIAKESPQTTLNQILNFVAPSFTSNTQTVADGTDHIDPAQLRGLGPDQTLVLLNGKRRHTSSLVNINGTPGRGSVGTDLNAIPAFALSKIEVLRDGAAAQYGSDAIAGVINLNLKRSTNGLSGALTAGANFSSESNNLTGGVDGENYQVDLNYGAKIGNKGGFINLTASAVYRDPTSRASAYSGSIYNIFNAIEGRARQNGFDFNNYFTNITTVSSANASTIINAIHQYAQQVTYLDPVTQGKIQDATSISTLQGLLSADVTNNELAYRGLTREDFNMRVGQSSLRSGQLFANAEVPLGENWKAYAFGGYGYRGGNSAGFYRRPVQANTFSSIYPNGFLPEIGSTIQDISFVGGAKGKMGEWIVDLSNTFGKNSFRYDIKNTGNTTMRFASPSEFYAGTMGFSQNTINLDISRPFDVLAGLNLAFGGEVRFENYKITAGDVDSYARYDVSGNPHYTNDGTPITSFPTDFFGAYRPAGSQVFPGFTPTNAINKNRTSEAIYADAELNFTKRFLADVALRYENYSDFGSTFNYKLALRYKLLDNLNVRAAAQTGFRAPSLQQKYFSNVSTQFIAGVGYQVATFADGSPIKNALIGSELKQEKSKSYSAGFTYKIPSLNLTFTADGYFVKIKDRITLTDVFARPTGPFPNGSQLAMIQKEFDAVGASQAIFFANSIDTETKGLDLVISHKITFSEKVSLTNDFGMNINKTVNVGGIHASDILANNGYINNYFSESSRVYLEEAIPRTKMNLAHSLKVGDFSFFVRNGFFGKITDPNAGDANKDGRIDAIIVNGKPVEIEHPVWTARVITDLSVGYSFTKSVQLVVGANNLFDVYPAHNYTSAKVSRATGITDGQIVYGAPVSYDLSNADQFVYSRNVSQFGMNGRYLFARINFDF
ncbi:iron complex outermembrane recepter protein [Epilithonimonas bovis DSM 19482]|uniref:Iron complex outermembrane recepter protein n=1 Tax=Epilithonimonas bovis DSM 19482 TaxID=1121284 RepID=A0A1U7PSC9_9FLAO|nr:TonB-dependent receptor [Epilithonimonas bovis]SIT96476.1 iron complex outermembrane recepter protein [Epilithonimonas bovis DSM 19482]